MLPTPTTVGTYDDRVEVDVVEAEAPLVVRALERAHDTRCGHHQRAGDVLQRAQQRKPHELGAERPWTREPPLAGAPDGACERHGDTVTHRAGDRPTGRAGGRAIRMRK